MFDITRYLCGEVEEVFARLHQVSEDCGTYSVNLRFAGGAVGLMSLNALESDTWHFNERFRVTGDQCWLELEDQLHLKYHPLVGWLPECLRGERALKNQTLQWEPSLILEQDSLELGGYVGEMRELARCALTGEQPAAALSDSAEALRIAEAIWESATSGQRVQLQPQQIGHSGGLK
jgi:predicted dehydrogenase